MLSLIQSWGGYVISALMGYIVWVAQQNYSMKQKLKQKDKEVEQAKKEAVELVNKQLQNDIELLKKSDMLSKRAYIIQTYERYVEIGSIPLYVKDLFDKQYSIYKQEGGNGFCERLHEIVMELPEEPD